MTETASVPETGPTAIADLPTGEPIPASTPADPKTPSSTTPPPPSPPPPPPRRSLAAPLKALPANADAFIAHLQRCLATPSGIDTLLLFICYTSRLTGAALASVSQSLVLGRPPTPRELVALAFALPAEKTARSVAPGARLAALLGARLKSLGSLASEARTIARLWSLVGMYFWAKRLVLNLVAAARSRSGGGGSEGSEKAAGGGGGGGGGGGQAESKLATLVGWVQLLSCGAFQVLENGAYLSGRGVLGWTPAQQGRAYVVGARFLGVYTALELGRLLAEFAARRGQSYSEASAEEQAQVDALRRSLAINMAWAPLTVHWSTEGGLVTDLVVGAGGCIPGVIQMRKLWRETA